MRRLVVALAVTGLFAGSARADDELDQLIAEHDREMSAWIEKFKALRDKAGDGPIDEAKLPPMPAKKYVPKFKAYAEGHAGKPETVEALMQVILLAGRAGGPPDRSNADADWAVGRLTRDHAGDESMAEHVPQLNQASWYIDSKALGRLYAAVSEKNKSRDAKAAARFGLALQRGTTNPMQPREISPEDRALALEMFRAIAADFPDSKVGKSAKSYIFELERLQVGMKAPEIEGKALDGTLIRLSQFRGQVVVLDFWGFW